MNSKFCKDWMSEVKVSNLKFQKKTKKALEKEGWPHFAIKMENELHFMLIASTLW